MTSVTSVTLLQLSQLCWRSRFAAVAARMDGRLDGLSDSRSTYFAAAAAAAAISHHTQLAAQHIVSKPCQV